MLNHWYALMVLIIQATPLIHQTFLQALFLIIPLMGKGVLDDLTNALIQEDIPDRLPSIHIIEGDVVPILLPLPHQEGEPPRSKEFSKLGIKTSNSKPSMERGMSLKLSLSFDTLM